MTRLRGSRSSDGHTPRRLSGISPSTILWAVRIYREKLVIDSTRPFVTLEGEDRFQTILSYDDHTGKISAQGDTINTYTSASFREAADDFTRCFISSGEVLAANLRCSRNSSAVSLSPFILVRSTSIFCW